MVSKVVRVSEEALAVTAQYSSDLSTAILIMQAKLEEWETKMPDMHSLEKMIKKTIADTITDYRRDY